MPFVDGRWMKAYRLIVGYISKALSISDQELWIEAPSNYRSCNNVIVAIHICTLRNIKELSASARKACSIHSQLWKIS